jgi:hypothetical protein
MARCGACENVQYYLISIWHSIRILNAMYKNPSRAHYSTVFYSSDAAQLLRMYYYLA